MLVGMFTMPNEKLGNPKDCADGFFGVCVETTYKIY